MWCVPCAVVPVRCCHYVHDAQPSPAFACLVWWCGASHVQWPLYAVGTMGMTHGYPLHLLKSADWVPD